MRDFQAFVRAHVARLDLPPARERKIVEEWAAQLEDVYDALRAGGLGDDDAWSEVQGQVRRGEILDDALLDEEPAAPWLAPLARRPAVRRTLRAVMAWLQATRAAGL